MKTKNKEQKRVIRLVEEDVEGMASFYSAATELIEACDWDDEKASKIFELVLEALIDIHEFSTYDKDLIQSPSDLENLLRMNTDYDGEEITEAQYKAVMNIMTVKILQEKKKEEGKKTLN